MKQASKKILRNLIFLTSLSIIMSCGQPFAKIEVTDKKSKIIEKIFQEVSAESTDYLEEVFSDEMKMVNPKEVEFDKASFISGIKTMYDLFDNITFESSDGDADGSEIETNYYSNGKVWTSIWNNFSATGKYTGQQINIPFHISYQWEGNKIIEEFQFFDMTAFENEATARNAQNNTSQKISFLIEMKINKGRKLDEIKPFLAGLTSFMRNNEPEGYDYGYYISEDGKKVTLIEKYLTSEAAIKHADNFEGGPNMKPFLEMFTLESFIITGNATDQLKDRLKAWSPKFRTPIGGWSH
jgi:predicted transposase YbfD/YdcC|tara:strand:- start:2456 stop:3346 length:891 start_codon:yes stop_codon:yes gene_type:complete